MPEIKHQFSSGRMNLDLDERLVPNGEYREAFNIQVSSSEGSNVGVLQNLLSNQQMHGGIIATGHTEFNCIGSISDEKNDALYWFVRPNFYYPTGGVDWFKGDYNITPPSTGQWADTNGLWQWKDVQSSIPGAWMHSVKTTIGQDMVVEYKAGFVQPVLVDQFEVICGVVDGEYRLPTIDTVGPTPSNLPIPYSTCKIRIDALAYQAVDIGWFLDAFTLGTNYAGTSSNLINTAGIIVSKKYREGAKYFIELEDTGVAASDFDDFILNIQSYGMGPAGFIKALYFVNPKPACNFRPVRHITGVNIIDDMMFWTDDYNEPKKINITRCKQGTPANGTRHTTLEHNQSSTGENWMQQKEGIKEEHITVIKKSPNNPLALELITDRDVVAKTNEDGWTFYESYSAVITTGSINQYLQTDDVISINGNTSAQTFGSLNIGDEFTVSVSRDTVGHDTSTGQNINFLWDVGDVVVLKEFDETNTDQPGLPLTDYTIKGTIDDIIGSFDPNWGWQSTTNPVNNLQVKIKVTSLTGTPPVPNAQSNTTGELRYVIDKFDQDKNIFEFKYPRFGYRYKYEDGEYSHFSPFTQPAFIPGGFDYHPKKGYNLGMSNRIGSIIVKNFIPDDIPRDVIEVDILYKDDLSPMVYVVDSVGPNNERFIKSPSWCLSPIAPISFGNSWNYWDLNAYKITEEQIKLVLPENQLLRIYDNVPRKALAQEVTGNRIVYGNYLQNFDLMDKMANPFVPSIHHYIYDYTNEFGNNRKDRSIKSLREYQLGVVFVDEFGRETPVLSTREAMFKVPKTLSDNNNRLSVGMSLSPPSGYFAKLKYFKFYIKETSGEWYNMAMDRWYDAGDGNIWMSFPSADRNKLTIDDFLILKKAAESSTAVLEDPARYKVLAIQNEAPDFIKRTYTLVDVRANGGNVYETQPTLIPRGGNSTFEMFYSVFYNTYVSNLHEQFVNKGNNEFYIQFENSGELSKRYKISSITSDIQFDATTGAPTNLSSAKFYFKTDKVLDDDVNMILDDPTNNTPTQVLTSAKTKIFRANIESRPEFDGRFFVKIFGDDIFDKYIRTPYNPNTDTEYQVIASVPLNYMNDQHHLMFEGDGTWKDSNSNSYHAGTGFPMSAADVKSFYWICLHPYDINDTTAAYWKTSNKLDNAYSLAPTIDKIDVNSNSVALGLRHFAPFFRKYTHAKDTSLQHQDPNGLDFYQQFVIWHSSTGVDYSSSGPVNYNNAFDPVWTRGFDPIYAFEYDGAVDNDYWWEEYNKYTTIPWRSYAPQLYVGNFGSSPYNNSTVSMPSGNGYWQQHDPANHPYFLEQYDLLWNEWWHTAGYRKKSDRKARDTEVWYINKGFAAGREYYTNNKQYLSTYGATQGRGIKQYSSTIQLEVALGGLWGDPKASMNGIASGAFQSLQDEGFYDIGKPNGNPSYQDAPTVAIVSAMQPGSYCRFKEDPTESIYQIIGVTEVNYFNYNKWQYDLSHDWHLNEVADGTTAAGGGWSNAGATLQSSYSGTYWLAPTNDLTEDQMGNKWRGDFWHPEKDPVGQINWEEQNSTVNQPLDIGLSYDPFYDAAVDGSAANESVQYGQTSSGVDIYSTHVNHISWTKNYSYGGQLSCNFSKGWRLTLQNIDSSSPNLMKWDPTGTSGVDHGPIANGVNIPILIKGGNNANGTTNHINLDTPNYSFFTDDLTNSDGEVLKVGMIATAFDTTTDGSYNVVFDDQIDATGTGNSKLYLQVVEIVDWSGGGITGSNPPDGTYEVRLGGYMRPLCLNDAYDFVDGGTILFEQAILNGYTENAIAKIQANMSISSNFDFGTSGTGAMAATEYTLEFLRPEEEGEVPLSDNPAVWETEPTDGPDLDIYYEASPRIPIELSKDTANDWIPTRYSWNPDGSFISYAGGGGYTTPPSPGQIIHNPYGSHENSIILPISPLTTFLAGFLPINPGALETVADGYEIVHVDGDILTLKCDKPGLIRDILFSVANLGASMELVPAPPAQKTIIKIRRPDGIIFTAEVLAHNIANNNEDPTGVVGLTAANFPTPGGLEPYVTAFNSGQWDPDFGNGPENSFRIKINKEIYGGNKKPNSLIELNWHNCYAFKNGVESNRIRDNFNTPFISNGVRVSTTLADYKQERRKSGLIYSGIYNSMSGVNNLNQFIQAEKITKDVNPSYGSIQKLHSRDTDLITLCEDKTLKILANKDAVYNADGNPQLTANINVLGQTIPFSGEYGISKNPESFASENYRAYFADKVRGAVLRLSKDGLTPISDAGMHDWFKDNLKRTDLILGSYDDEKQEYNVTLKNSIDHVPEWTSLAYYVAPENSISSGKGIVVSYDERVRGWVSFKSFGLMESGLSCANKYYTIHRGILWHHHSTNVAFSNAYNNFYEEAFKSQVNVLLNDEPSIIKSFKTIGYEGSQAKVLPHVTGSGEYNDFTTQFGWYSSAMNTNMDEGSAIYFKEKESKWFSRIKGSDNQSQLDMSSFANQGVGFLDGVVLV